MSMDLGLDTGPVLMTEATPISPLETTGDLHDRLARMGASLIVETLKALPSLAASPQPEDGVTYAVKVDKSEAMIDWTRDAASVDRQIRGLSPFPGAWCEIDGERVKLLRSEKVDQTGAPGAHLGQFTIACQSGAVRILEAQRAGKRPMPAQEILRGMTLPESLL